MSGNWHWAIDEAMNAITTRYDAIGRTTGVPFLAIIYPPGEERGFWHELEVRLNALSPGIESRYVDLLGLTTRVIEETGIDQVVEVLEDPFLATQAESDLARLWLDAVRDEVRATGEMTGVGRPIIVIKGSAALFPVAGPFMLMQTLWNDEASRLACPILIPIPGSRSGPRSYRFLDRIDELMYRGDLL
ncbi:hypothetical protein DSECCO2_413260 [anaerobic digester metagenome]